MLQAHSIKFSTQMLWLNAESAGNQFLQFFGDTVGRKLLAVSLIILHSSKLFVYNLLIFMLFVYVYRMF